MSLKDLMLQQLAISRLITADGHENVPAWRIETPDGAWLILTRFDPTSRDILIGRSISSGASWRGGLRRRSS